MESHDFFLPPPWVTPAIGKSDRKVSPMIIIPRRRISGFDADALAWIAAIETADGLALEDGVKSAYNDFVVGCKADASLNAGVSNWDAMQQILILRGPRTLTGALYTPKGPVVTNIGFVTGDYSRKVDLKGSGTKYINLNRGPQSDPQNNTGAWLFINRAATTNNTKYFGSQTAAAGVQTYIGDFSGVLAGRINSATGYGGPAGSGPPTGFVGAVRNSSTAITVRYNSTNFGHGSISGVPTSNNYFLFARNVEGAANGHTDAGIAAYGSGGAVDLALMQTRVTTLLAAIAAAIP
jgi:hypothetical protein